MRVEVYSDYSYRDSKGMPYADMGDSVRAKALLYIKEHQEANISEIARALLLQAVTVRDKLFVAQRNGHVTGEMKKMMSPTGGWIMVHMFKITAEGEAWLRSIGA